MKRLLTILVIAALTFGVTGCKTATNPSGIVVIGGVTLDPAATGVAVEVAAKLGAIATIDAKPDTRQYFALASDVINTAIASGNYNPTNIQNLINQKTGNNLVSASIADALLMYEAMFGQIVTAGITNQSPYLLPVIQGLGQGISEAVALTASGPNLANYTPVPATANIPLMTHKRK